MSAGKVLDAYSHERAAAIVRVWSSDPTLAGRHNGLAVQEAFVAFFREDPSFDIQAFREACKPIRKIA